MLRPRIAFRVTNHRTKETRDGESPELLLESIPDETGELRDWLANGSLACFSDGREVFSCPLFGCASPASRGITLAPNWRAVNAPRVLGFPPPPVR